MIPLFLFLLFVRIFPCFGGLYLSPDFFYRSFKELTYSEAKSKEFGWLSGIQAGFDYDSLWSPYLGVSFRFAEGKTRFDGTIQHHLLKQFFPFQSYTDNTFFSIEGRLGYSLAYGKFRYSPFFAMGSQEWGRKACDRTTGYDEWYRWSYLAIGLRSLWLYSALWQGGFSFHLMRMKTADVQIRGVCSWPIILTLQEKWQTEAECSFSYCPFPYAMSWVGYFRYLPIGKSETQKMRRGEIFVPASTTYVIGNRLEFIVQF